MKTFRFLLIAVICILAGGGIALGQCVPPPSGMVAWYPLDEQAGATQVNDIAGFNNVGTPQPGPVGFGSGPAPVVGLVGAGALYFYTGHYVDVPSQSELDFGTGDFSIDGWVRAVGCGPGILSPIVDKLDIGSNTGFSFYLDQTPPGTAFLKLQVNGSTFTSTGSFIANANPPGNTGTWYHLAVTVQRSPAVGVFYINGVSAGTFTPPAGTVTNTLPMWIGEIRVPGGRCEIAIDELELFNRALDSLEVYSLWHADSLGKCKPCPDCPDNIIQNWSFINGAVPGPMPSPGQTSNWTAAYGTPDVSLVDGCCDSAYVGMWGNQVVGEALRQTLATPFVLGGTYAVSFCARWHQEPNRPYPPQYAFRASNVPLTGPLDPNGTWIGVSPPVTSSSWTTVTLPNWVASQNFSILTVSVTNQSSANHGDSVTYSHIDRICIRPTFSLYWKPPYPDYAPSGMPDIDQKQDSWGKQTALGWLWTFCGPVAVANCFKWFDSKYNVPPGFPGDGMDQFPLVRDYLDNLPPLVGFDDHDPWNMDHVATPWLFGGTPPPPATMQPFVPGPQMPGGGLPPWGELVERLAWYFDTDGVRTTYCSYSGTDVMRMQEGILMWLNSESFPDSSTLADTFCEHTWQKPTFALVESLVEKCEDVILLLGFWVRDPADVMWRVGGHYVTVAGVNSDSLWIGFSDPFIDAFEQGITPRGRVGDGSIITHAHGSHGVTDHNDEGNVSHDVYTATLNDPPNPHIPPGGLWYIPSYAAALNPSLWMYNFQGVNVPTEFVPWTAPWDGSSPIFTMVEYAVQISPWDYRGDVNNNGTVALGDVVYLITYLYKGGPPPPVMTEADMNCDGVVNLGDVVFLITYLYKNGPVPKCCDP